MTSKILLFFFFALPFSSIQAQLKAVTENGDEVTLYDDGSWSYNEEQIEPLAIRTNNQSFEKDKSATFLVKSKRNTFGFWNDPKLWTLSKSGANEDVEYFLQMKDEDLYAMLISEKIEIPVENLREIAFQNAKNVASDLKIVDEEYRKVNGLDVLMLQMDGTIQGIKFSYYGYYYSNSEGTVQFVTYTAQNLLKGYKDDCEKLLNGLVSLKK